MDTRRNKTNYYLDIAEEVSSWVENDENTVYDADAFAEQILTESHKWWK